VIRQNYLRAIARLSLNSGIRGGAHSTNHGSGAALDTVIEKLGPNGKWQTLDNYQEGGGANAGIYQRFNNHMKLAQEKYYPKMSPKMRFGGYFGGKKYGSFDLMHNDTQGAWKQAGGKWEHGYTKAQMKLWGIDPSTNQGMSEFRQSHSYDLPAEPTIASSPEPPSVVPPVNSPETQPMTPVTQDVASPAQPQSSVPSSASYAPNPNATPQLPPTLRSFKVEALNIIP
jgi:hypothetical protein